MIYFREIASISKYIVTAVAVIGLVIASIYFGLLEALFLLYMTGAVPGTSYTVSADIMSLLMSSIIVFTIFGPFARDTLRTIYNQNDTDESVQDSSTQFQNSTN